MDHLMSPPWRVLGMQILAAALLVACGGGAEMSAPLSNGGNVPQTAPAHGDSVPQTAPANGNSVPQVAPAQSCDFSQALVMVNEMRIRQVDASDIIVTLPEPRPIDLLDPGTGVLEALQAAPLTRDAIDVRLRTSDGTVRLADGTMAPLKVAGQPAAHGRLPARRGHGGRLGGARLRSLQRHPCSRQLRAIRAER